MEETARAAGRTVREGFKEWCGNRLDPSQPSSEGSECSCEGTSNTFYLMKTLRSEIEHSTPLFCPEALVNHRSQDFPEFISIIQHQHRIPVDEIQIQAFKVSRRLDQDMLEYARTLDLPKSTICPAWAKQNQYVQKHLTEQNSINRNDPPCMEGDKWSNANPQDPSPRTYPRSGSPPE